MAAAEPHAGVRSSQAPTLQPGRPAMGVLYRTAPSYRSVHPFRAGAGADDAASTKPHPRNSANRTAATSAVRPPGRLLKRIYPISHQYSALSAHPQVPRPRLLHRPGRLRPLPLPAHLHGRQLPRHHPGGLPAGLQRPGQVPGRLLPLPGGLVGAGVHAQPGVQAARCERAGGRRRGWCHRCAL